MKTQVIRLVSIFFMAFLFGCHKEFPPPEVNVLIAPANIEIGDSFNIVLVSSGKNRCVPELANEKIEKGASITFISSHQDNDYSISCYKIRPRKSGPQVITRDFIQVPAGRKVNFEKFTVNVSPNGQHLSP